MSIRTPLATLGLTLAIAGSLSAQKVSTDWDHSANWSKYNSYYIQIQKAFGDQLSQERAIAAVDSALKSKGWKKVSSLDASSAGMGMATTSTSSYEVGTLVVDIFDTQTKQLLFRGQAQETVSNNAEKNTKNLYKATEKMFKDFPPTAAK